MNENDIIEFISKLRLKSHEWQNFMAENELSTEQRGLVLETLALIAIAIEVCYELLDKGASFDLIDFSGKLTKALTELLRLHDAVKEHIDFDSLPDFFNF